MTRLCNGGEIVIPIAVFLLLNIHVLLYFSYDNPFFIRVRANS